MTWLRKIDSPCRPECGMPENSTVAQAIILAVQGGAAESVAAGWAGIWPDTLNRWKQRGIDHLAHMARNNQETPDNTEKPYAELVLELAYASTDCEMRLTAMWHEEMEGDWRAIAKFMSLRFRERWGDVPRRVELSGPSGGPVQVAAAVMSLDEAEAMLVAIQERAEREEHEVLELEAGDEAELCPE